MFVVKNKQITYDKQCAEMLVLTNLNGTYLSLTATNMYMLVALLEFCRHSKVFHLINVSFLKVVSVSRSPSRNHDLPCPFAWS